MPIVGLGMPAFWLGIMLILLLAAAGLEDLPGRRLRRRRRAGTSTSMFLPALTVAIGTAPLLIRSLRASLLGVLESDYITTARAKGLPERRVLIRHALRNGIMPMITVLGINLGFLIGNTVVVEKVFALPGVGAMIYDGISQRDFAVVQGVTLVLAALVVLVNIAIDITLFAARSAREVRLMAAVAASSTLAPTRDRAAAHVPQPLVPHAVVRGRRDDRARARRSRALAAPLIARYDPNAQDLLHTYAHPSGAHWLGTDQLGRDVYARLIYAGRVDLLTRSSRCFFPFCIGTLARLPRRLLRRASPTRS